MRRALPLLCLFSVGCAELEGVLPTVHFDRFAVERISFEDIDADFVFRVENPNPVEIDLASFSYALQLEEVQLLDGNAEDGFVLERSGSSELALPVHLVFEQVYETITATRGEDVVDFSLAGHFGFDTPAGLVRLPYRELGDFPALRTPGMAFQRLDLTQLRVDGADLKLDIAIDNPHGSTLFFENFAYTVKMQGFDVVDGLIEGFDVGGATAHVLSIPIQVDFLKTGLGLATALIEGEEVKLDLAAQADVDTPFGLVPLTLKTSDGLTPE